MLNNNQKKGGFTLIEIIVSLGVFSVVILIILGAVFSIINLQRKTSAFRAAQENLSYAFESMAKEIRTGHKYGSNYDLSNGKFVRLTFINDTNREVLYEVDASGRVTKSTNDIGQPHGNPMPLTSSEVFVESLKFEITGAGPEGNQPMVRAMISGVVGKGTKYEASFFLQTAITQRKPDS